MTEREAEEWIAQRGRRGSVYGLDNIRALLERLGSPQKGLPVVHLAGTNGKGSVLAFVSEALQSAGYRTGRYSSPAVFSYRERIQVQGRPIARAALTRIFGRIAEAAEGLEEAWREETRFVTAFEIETAAAFLYFREKRCDIAVIEAGLGGALDATNVVTDTVAAVFTSISRDHMALLGDTLPEIARQKAGIIKPGCLVLTARQTPEVLDVLRERAKACGAAFLEPPEVSRVRYGLRRQSFSLGQMERLEIALAGTWQIENAALAAATVCALEGRGFPVREDRLRDGLLRARWDGRFTLIGEKPCFVIDGAHNADGAKKLADSIRFYFTNRRIVYIMGILRDKEYEAILRSTAELAEHILTVTPPDNPRAMHAYELAQEARRFHPSVTAVDSLAEAVELSRLLAGKDGVIVAFGSLSYLGRLKEEAEKDGRGNRHGKSGKDQRGGAPASGGHRRGH